MEKAAKQRKTQEKEKLAAMKENDEKDKGRLAPSAASIGMNILYGARFVRMDLLRVVGVLLRIWSRWF